MKGTIQATRREGHPEKQSPIIQNSNYEAGGGRSCSGRLSLLWEDREGFVHLSLQQLFMESLPVLDCTL